MPGFGLAVLVGFGAASLGLAWLVTERLGGLVSVGSDKARCGSACYGEPGGHAALCFGMPWSGGLRSGLAVGLRRVSVGSVSDRTATIRRSRLGNVRIGWVCLGWAVKVTLCPDRHAGSWPGGHAAAWSD